MEISLICVDFLSLLFFVIVIVSFFWVLNKKASKHMQIGKLKNCCFIFFLKKDGVIMKKKMYFLAHYIVK